MKSQGTGKVCSMKWRLVINETDHNEFVEKNYSLLHRGLGYNRFAFKIKQSLVGPLFIQFNRAITIRM